MSVSSRVSPSDKIWRCRDRLIPWGDRTRVMGIVNVTPDSFSDGGRFLETGAAIDHALRLEEEGADILDIGGESTRPGAEPVSAADELARVLPVIAALAERSRLPLSVDTSKAEVAREAMAAGASIVNDVTALRGDTGMAGVVAETGAGVVLMHMRGTPETMQREPVYDDVVAEVKTFLRARMEAARAAGIAADALCIDPGFGFGKTLDHNLALLAALPECLEMGAPVLVGISRKRMLGALTGGAPEARLAAGLAAHGWAVARGAQLIRVHDVKESCDMVKIMDKLKQHHGRPL